MNCKYFFKDNGPIILSFLLIITLLILPTGFEQKQTYQNADRVKARVISTDNSDIVDNGLIRTGEQKCNIKILEGKFKGTKATAINRLNGSLSQDKIFESGDKAFVVISHNKNVLSSITMIDHFRLEKEIVLISLFILFLIIFAGKTGIRAVLSFITTILLIWKVLVPCMLKGINPIWISMGIVLAMTMISLSLIYGFDRRCLASSLGVFLGIIVTATFGIIFTKVLKIHGAVMESSESLLYAGFQHLNLTQIFMASIFLGSAGAIMDLSVDICSAIYEIIQKKNDISRYEVIKSGFAIGKAACGSTTTTLLLAYSGSYITLLMVFMAQGTPIEFIFNYKYVAAEIIHTIIGSFGLITVAPLTAITSGFLLTKNKKLLSNPS